MNSQKAAKLASACRSLAAELEEGRGPELGHGRCFLASGPCCAVGHALHRAGFDSGGAEHVGNCPPVSKFLEYGTLFNQSELSRTLDRLTCANDEKDAAVRAKSVIAPLRNLAEKLEQEAAQQLPNYQENP